MWCAMVGVSLSILTFQGCTKEDKANCGISVRFFYEKNVYFADKFSNQVSQIELYIFDANGNYVETHTASGSQQQGGGPHLPKDFTMKLTHIRPGTYTLVAWGNVDHNLSYAKQVPNFNEAELNLNVVETTGHAPRTENTSLFHGCIQQLVVSKDAEGTQEFDMPLTKFSNLIEVTKKGLPSNPLNPSFHCYITSKNGGYKFDGSYANTDEVRYNPYPVSVELDGSTIISTFNVLRELNNNATDSRLIVEHELPSGDLDEIYNESLVELLALSAGTPFDAYTPNNTGDLDRDDQFRIEALFDLTAGTVTIKINDWEVVKKPLSPLL